jgi:hypothetical protein
MLGQTGALNYKINPQFIGGPPQQGAPQGVAPVQAEIPAMEQDPLAVREGLTNDYYQNYNMLKKYIEVLSKDGIDPFDPYADPVVFQTMNKLQANVLHAANALKGEFDAEKQMRLPIATGQVGVKQGVDQRGLYAQNADNYYSAQPTYATQELNRRLGQNTNTRRDQDAFNAEIQPYIQQIEQQVQQGILSPEEGEIQKQSIFKNVYTTPVFAPQRPWNDPFNKYKGSIGLLKKYTNLSQGVWQDGSYRTEERDGEVYLVNSEGQGDVLGRYNAGFDKNGNPVYKDKVVKGWMKNADTGQVYIEFTDPSIEPELVSNQPGDAVAMKFVSNNPKYGSVDKMNEAMEVFNIGNGLGGSANEYLTPENAPQIKERVLNSAGPMKEGVKQVVSRIKKELSDLPEWNAILSRNSVSYKLPNGKELDVKKNGKNSYALRGDWKQSDFEGVDINNLSEDQIIKILSKTGFFNSKTYVQGGQGKVTGKQQKAVEAFTKQFGRQPNQNEMAKILAKYN